MIGVPHGQVFGKPFVAKRVTAFGESGANHLVGVTLLTRAGA